MKSLDGASRFRADPNCLTGASRRPWLRCKKMSSVIIWPPSFPVRPIAVLADETTACPDASKKGPLQRATPHSVRVVPVPQKAPAKQPVSQASSLEAAQWVPEAKSEPFQGSAHGISMWVQGKPSQASTLGLWLVGATVCSWGPASSYQGAHHQSGPLPGIWGRGHHQRCKQRAGWPEWSWHHFVSETDTLTTHLRNGSCSRRPLGDFTASPHMDHEGAPTLER